MSIVKFKNPDTGTWDSPEVIRGAPGKSAYDYAKEAGYTGSEAEFAEKLGSDFSDIVIDNTLKISGAAADAKAVGDLFASQKRRFSGFLNTNTTISIDSANRTITFGAQSYVTWGTERIEVSNMTFTLAEDLKWGGYLFFDPVKKQFVKTYSDGFIYVGALWFPFWKHDLNAERDKIFVDGMPVTYTGKYLNKKVNCLGDSMTDTSITPKPYCMWLPQLLGFDKNSVRNYGLGGSSITPKTDAVPTWDTAASFLERYAEMDDDADAVIVFGGVNDWVTGRSLGDIGDNETDTFYGAMKALCQGLTEKYPVKDIYVFSSPQNDYVGRPATDLAGTQWTGNIDGYNRKGHKLEDYVRAMGEVCAVYGIPFCDMAKGLWWGLSGVLGQYKGNADGTHIAGPLGNDGLHPNAEGHKKIALRMAEFIDSGGSDATEPFPDHVPTPATAQVGQTIVVKEVDENGKPVSWECMDVASGDAWRKIVDYTTAGQVWTPDIFSLDFSADLDGNPFSLKMIMIKFSGTITGGTSYRIAVNQITGGFADFSIPAADTPFCELVFFVSGNGVLNGIGPTGGATASGNINLTTIKSMSKVKDGADSITLVSLAGPNYNAVHLQPGARIEIWGVDDR